MIALKTIVYRGGVVRFRIPINWQEEYESAGGGIFYAPGEETGTLRLNITTAHISADSPLFPVNPELVLRDFAGQHGVGVQTLRPGVAMIRFDLQKFDRGQAILIRSWQIAQAIADADLRIALFTYTLLADRFSEPESQEELDLLERELTVAEFATTLGHVTEQIRKSKPWWRFW